VPDGSFDEELAAVADVEFLVPGAARQFVVDLLLEPFDHRGHVHVGRRSDRGRTDRRPSGHRLADGASDRCGELRVGLKSGVDVLRSRAGRGLFLLAGRGVRPVGLVRRSRLGWCGREQLVQPLHRARTDVTELLEAELLLRLELPYGSRRGLAVDAVGTGLTEVEPEVDQRPLDLSDRLPSGPDPQPRLVLMARVEERIPGEPG